MDGIIADEENLEQKIKSSIEQQLKSIKELCFELQIRMDDIKSVKNLSAHTIIEQDESLRKETKKLHAEKKKRMEEYTNMIELEHDLCKKLVVKKTEPKTTVYFLFIQEKIRNMKRIRKHEKCCI